MTKSQSGYTEDNENTQDISRDDEDEDLPADTNPHFPCEDTIDDREIHNTHTSS